VEVQVDVASLESVGRTFEVGGTVRAQSTASLVSRIVAPVDAVLVQPGEAVRAGQVLVRLDARDLQAGRAQAEAAAAAADQAIKAATSARQGAEASLAMATATHKRIAELRAKNSSTPHELDQAVNALRAAESQAAGSQAAIAQSEAAAEAARASLRVATVALSWATITAPFDGVVTEKLVEPGNMAAPGVALVTVEDTRAFRLEVRVDESRASQLATGSPVSVLLDTPAASPPAPGRLLDGRVSEIARALDPGSHAFLVKIALPDGSGVRSGMFGRARFSGPAHQALVVPATAVIRRGQLASVFVTDSGNRARLRLINAAEAVDGRVEVSAGLDAGETVVVGPPPTLQDGMLVRTRAAARPAAGAASRQEGR
jgi:RND family efflux transporter MFP subunit